LYQAILDGETMTSVFVGNHGTGQVAHDLVHIDQDLRSTLGIEGNRLNLRVDLTPLFGPICADFIRSVDKTAFECPWPAYVGAHESESGANVARVESRIGRAQQLDCSCALICHER
jgi:hypothetical protein